MTRQTGFPPEVRDLIIARAHGMCEIAAPGCTQFGEQIHHRRPRGIGGTRRTDTNRAANGLMACAACHSHIESRRAEAIAAGWLVRQHEHPRAIPVKWRKRRFRFLDDHGGFMPPTTESAGESA